ncbi:MAG: hypothetical protein IJW26_02780 [Clostridia bacterium]|nr:hypothetical protein [Clostridia bacterium]
METKTIKLRCESCGASLVAKEGKEFMYCEHCGTKIYLVAKQEINHTYRDETKIRQTELDAEAKLKQAQLDAQLEREREERKIKSTNAGDIAKLIISLGLLGLAIFIFASAKDDVSRFMLSLPAILCIFLAAIIHIKFPE